MSFAGSQINPIDVNFHLQKCSEIFDEKSDDKIWSKKDKEIKVSPLMPIRVKIIFFSTGAITDLQRLLREAGDRYGALEDHFEKEKVEHKEEVKRRNEAIRVLRKELTDANQLIEDLKHKCMTDEGNCLT